ncbi:S8 family peptidase [Sphingomicrobium astaxanthinifaciens]|uniref:S8 family peptidase n=1 Tax=Sphingomicrobium astaxanthinifaciens TaxID=1227949 RepID=UPI001FCBC160|nr:S8 family peptidase [Sphingomicrobium astaxanthinifaciens]MCJ7420304.1 S8 family serine peptidase [Sphingomicrobium astaxanthinifaciens]
MKTKYAISVASAAIMVSASHAAYARDKVEPTIQSGRQTAVVTPQSLRHGVVETAGGTVDPLYGTIDPFYGTINPFYGDIQAFWGTINPFYGTINPFYGTIEPFYGTIQPFYGTINPFYGDIQAFWGDIQAFHNGTQALNSTYLTGVGEFWAETTAAWSDIDQQWAAVQVSDVALLTVADATALNSVHRQLLALMDKSKAKWGSQVAEKTGKSFEEAFANVIFARHGIDINDPNSLANLNAIDRARFFMDWHDSLMTYSGFDHVDHWMGAINWTPAITQQQGSGADTVIGIIDSSIVSSADLADNVLWSGGNEVDLGGHGAGVASLIYAAHDGEGVMGIAPNAKITAYNPFGVDGTAEWSDVTTAIVALKTLQLFGLDTDPRASIINLSLGESGWTLAPGTNDVFSDPLVAAFKDDTVYVVAAGNDGVAQTQDIEWNFATDPSLIVVGSVNPSGSISQFSNKPGNACLLDNGVCYEENLLQNRFIVAPGEMILVADGQGGFVRRSGTSFAAPLVSGAIALIHDRWPWLAQHPDETVEIIFRSARDLGDPGVDPVYGWGMLDVIASQSPLDFGALQFTLFEKKGRFYHSYNARAQDIVASGIPSTWETSEVFFHMLEHIGDTHRDFSVPMSTVLYGKSTNVNGSWQYLQSYISSRFAEWILSGGTDSDGDGRAGFSDIQSMERPRIGSWGLRYDAILPRLTHDGILTPTHMAATMEDPTNRIQLTVGSGQGALALNGRRFNMVSDHDRHLGGVNPVLGFASGDAFAAARYQLSEHTGVKVGLSHARTGADDMVGLDPIEFKLRDRLEDHRASALSVKVDHQLASGFGLELEYTRLNEGNALFGTQSTLPALIGSGSATESVSLSAGLDLAGGFSIDASATLARSEMEEGQAIAATSPILSSASQLTVKKSGLLAKRDAIRISVAQPLNVERGEMELVSLGVTDRETGDLGEVVQTFSIKGKRRLVGEAAYLVPVSQRGELSLYARYEAAGAENMPQSHVLGGSLNIGF